MKRQGTVEMHKAGRIRLCPFSELKMGVKEEMEHTDSRKVALRIALDHLWQIPDYYTRLTKMERDAKRSVKMNATKPLMCPYCRGRGYRKSGYYAPSGTYRHTILACHKCNGTGKK
jgi:hypothetical protein